jgi:tetratricopeptide (TPR) repeat protein
MDHPNIARVLDAGATEAGRPYFVMELVKGVLLTAYCDEHRLTPRERLELFVPVCQAIQHAHTKGIIHRDVKPSNVLVALYDGRPVPKVIDFGIAKAVGQHLTEKTLVTGFGNVVGTLEYMSPEQAELNALDIDTRSDVYSLGVLLYELLTGSTPLPKKRLKEAALLEALRLIREEEPPRPSTRLSTTEELPAIAAHRGLEPKKLSGLVRGELDWIVMKALDKDRNRRYQTADGFARDVQRYLADEPVLACPPSAAYRLRKFARRNRAAVLTAAGVLALVLVAGAGLWSWQHQEALRRTENALHAELARRGAESSLAQLPELYRRALWGQAEALLEQADRQLEAGGDGALRQRLTRARHHTAFLRGLDTIRLAKSVLVAGKENLAGARIGYRDAFAANGLDVLGGDPVELAGKLNDSPVRDYLLAALDDWALHEDANNRQRLLALTAAATGQEWRRQVHAFWDDGVRLSQVYDAIPDSERTPAVIIVVAIRLKELGQDGIVRRLEQGLRLHPGDFWLHSTLGFLQRKERPDAAIGAFRTALALRPNTAVPLHNLGVVLSEKKEYDAAIAEFREAIRLDPAYAEPHHGLGVALHARKEYDAAIAEFKEAIRLEPDHAVAHNNLGNTLYRRGEYDAAVAEYKEAVRLDPAFAVPHYSLGSLLMDRKEYDAAAAEFKEAVRLDPRYAAPHNHLGRILQARKEYDAALAEYREAVRLDPDYAPAHNNLGTVLAARKEYDAAVAAFKETVRLNPGNGVAHGNLGLAYRELGRFAESVAALREAARLMPYDLPGQLHLRRANELLALDQQLTAFRQGKARPKTPAEAVALAAFAMSEFKQEYGLAVRLFADAFAADARLPAGHRYPAACAACWAAAGRGKDAGQFGDRERPALRRQALDWLRAHLELAAVLLDRDPDRLRKMLEQLLASADLASVHGPEALVKLPEAERQAWQQFWDDVARLLARAQQKTTPEKQPGDR